MKKITLATLVLVSVYTQIALANEWLFDVYLDNSQIGQHRFELISSNNDRRTLVSEANFKVKVLFINAYEYAHKATEVWHKDCLQFLTAHTVENDEVTDVKATLQDNTLLVENGKETQSLPACVMTFAYWNPTMLRQTHLLNPQNAEYLTSTITKLKNEDIEVKSKTINAQHYKLMGTLGGKNKLNIELWYDSNNNWVALKSITPEGYTISYKLK